MIWRGSISFGLINIPVTVQLAVADHDLNFNFLDKRNLSRIKYNRVNEKTGQIVANDQIVKGFEYKKGKYVILTDRDFKAANPKASQMIEIDTFVDQEEIDPMYFEKPYYLVPEKNSQKSYYLFQQALAQSKKVAIAKVVMHTKEHLTCIFSRGKFLILEIMRFSHHFKDPQKTEYLKNISVVKTKPQELQMAKRLIEEMMGKWDPGQYKDTYYQDLMKHIQKRVSSGQIKQVQKVEHKTRESVPSTPPANLMALLKESMHHAKHQ